MPEASDKFTIRIDSILGGFTPNIFTGRDDQFDASIGIDPDQPMAVFTDSGVLMPTTYSDFTSANLTDDPMWLMTPPRGTELLYAYCADGKLLSYDTSFTEALVTTTGGTQGQGGRGGVYYNNYIYMAYGSSETRQADIARWGPLDGTPALQESWWGSTIGLTDLDNETYPTVQGSVLPNHPMHVHTDGRLYVGDFDSSTSTAATRGRGLIHFIETEFATDEGTADNGSTYNALDLPFGMMPVDIESYGTDLAILAIPATSGATFRGGRASIFFWDTLSDAFYRRVDISDPGAGALLYHNGRLYIFSGSYTQGCRVSVYLGGNEIQQIAFLPYAEMAFAGGVEGLGDRIYWGSRTTYPDNAGCVFALGYKNMNIPALHNIISSDGAMVTSLLRARQDSFNNTDLIVGSNSPTIDRRTGDPNTSKWRTKAYQVGQPFSINRVSFGVGEAIAANHTLTVRLFESLDNTAVDPGGTTGVALETVNNTNFADSERRIVLTSDFEGVNDFQMQLAWTGTNTLPVLLPIIIEGELLTQKTR
jgi:hypothetical protein|tara:strand:- start:1215 stop:2819 length:1605 start_codon:yes stop_codon:yes gene_type:complete